MLDQERKAIHFNESMYSLIFAGVAILSSTAFKIGKVFFFFSVA